MIHAYDEVYLSNAQTVMARMMDFAVYEYGYSIREFFDMFISSGTADRFGNGDFTLITGKSGVELAYEVMDKSQVLYDRIKSKYTMNRSQEYWLGWALAYYQWYTGMSFREIVSRIPIDELLLLYSPYHEMDIRQFVDKVNELYLSKAKETKLKEMRLKAGLSQSQLAELAGIPVRTIQQYEQRQKDINKAKVDYLIRLSKVLYCDIEVLIERVGCNERK